jgi:hypothetical protein
MNQSNILIKPIVNLKTVELVNFSVVFIAIGILLPLVTHQFGMAGAIFLPMHLFVLTAGLLFGWRMGLLVGLMTPLTSHVLSGMPLLPVLPQITFEVMLYGLVAGLSKEVIKTNVFTSLLMAMVAGRFGSLIFLTIVRINHTSPLAAVWNATKTGWIGIILQLLLVPLIVIFVKKILSQKNLKTKKYP